MRVLVDMNLSPAWVSALAAGGHQAVHWSAVGDPRASDADLLDWARQHGHLVPAHHDLDLGTLLALTRVSGPSVIQVRTQAVLPADVGPLVLSVLEGQKAALEVGALVTIDPASARVRILPFGR